MWDVGNASLSTESVVWTVCVCVFIIKRSEVAWFPWWFKFTPNTRMNADSNVYSVQWTWAWTWTSPMKVFISLPHSLTHTPRPLVNRKHQYAWAGRPLRNTHARCCYSCACGSSGHANNRTIKSTPQRMMLLQSNSFYGVNHFFKYSLFIYLTA